MKEQKKERQKKEEKRTGERKKERKKGGMLVQAQQRNHTKFLDSHSKVNFDSLAANRCSRVQTDQPISNMDIEI